MHTAEFMPVNGSSCRDEQVHSPLIAFMWRNQNKMDVSLSVSVSDHGVYMDSAASCLNTRRSVRPPVSKLIQMLHCYWLIGT